VLQLGAKLRASGEVEADLHPGVFVLERLGELPEDVLEVTSRRTP
jgi:hypothetical protein